ncbi:porin family protein [Agriterribacter sp.]|mgnify:FL=1|uniref:porin family protein n=1 Tax=Agriterribacter sp. TaxID=2821509 RepID=UPI002CA4BE73|nr:porin family protein [Agriterribacter sp.]HRO45136.1 porin family protein [Agriterribacter sp.]HRQ19516.1 porin family protein [Agriterribacter sp.]
MKRFILSVACISFLFIASSVSAQGIKLAIHAGANMGKLDGKSFKDEYQLGYHLGVAPEIMFSSKWGIQPEVLFSQTNTTTSTDFHDIYKVSVNELKDVKLNYLSIPLMLSYRPFSFFTLQAGPQFSILMNKHNTLLENGGEAFKNGDFSMVGGAQVNILKLRVYGRYGIGLSNINDIDNRDNWKSQTVQLGVGIAL